RVSSAIGPSALLVLFSGEPRVYANDVDYPFRQENNLYYLTNLTQMNATLVMLPGNTPLLFIPRRNPAAETWTGHMYSPEEVAQVSGIDQIWEASEFEPFIKAIRNHQVYSPPAEKILLSSPAGANAIAAGYDALFTAATRNEAVAFQLAPSSPTSREYTREQRYAADWAKSPPGISIRSAAPIFSEMRLSKS